MSRGAMARQRRRQRRMRARAEARGRDTALSLDTDALVAGAQGSTDLPLSDRNVAWDAGAAQKSLQPGDFAKAFFWRDASKPADQITSYKLPFAKRGPDGLQAVWRGVTAGAARLPVTQIPSADKSGVQGKMAAYYSKAAKQYNDDTIEVPWKGDASADTAVFDDSTGHTPEPNTIPKAHKPADRVPPRNKPKAAPSLNDVAKGAADEIESLLDGLAADEPAVFAPAMSAKCADCGHMALAHGGSNHMGACSMQNCDCDGFATKGESAAELAAFYLPGVALEGAIITLNGEIATGTEGTYTITSFEPDGDQTLFLAFDPDFAKKAVEPEKVKLPRAKGETPGGFHPASVGGSDEPEPDDEDDDEDEDKTTPYAQAVEVTIPDAHQPGQKLPRKNRSPKAPASTMPDPNMAMKWTATLAPEGKATDDGRIFAPGSITWRQPPLTLMAQTKTADGHDGAEVCGRIDRIWRSGDDQGGYIMAEGEFDSGEFGQEIARLVNDGTLRGVSVDIAPQQVDTAYRDQVVDEEGNWRTDAPGPDEGDGPSALDLLFGGSDGAPPIYVVRQAVLGMATVCPFQAFSDAKIEPGASLTAAVKNDMIWTVTIDAGWRLTAKPKSLRASADEALLDAARELAYDKPDVITASAAGLAPDAPPLDWFDDPELTELTALTVDADGHVYGHAAAWGTCHIGIPDVCTTAPHSITNYAYYHLKEIETDDGARVNVGTVTLDTGHADRNLGRQAAAAHYDDTGTAVADVVCGEDAFGIWVNGAIRADADAEQVRKLRGAALSGDWRNVNGNLELVALLAVNVPGFPIPRAQASLQASAAGMEVISVIAAGTHTGLEGLTQAQRREWDALRAVANDEWAALAKLAIGDVEEAA